MNIGLDPLNVPVPGFIPISPSTFLNISSAIPNSSNTRPPEPFLPLSKYSTPLYLITVICSTSALIGAISPSRFNVEDSVATKSSFTSLIYFISMDVKILSTCRFGSNRY